MKPKTVYQSVPCHLSQSSPAPHEQTQTAAVINPSFSLHIDTDIVIIDGDALEITHNGQTWKGIAGQPFHRTFVNVIPVKAEKVV